MDLRDIEICSFGLTSLHRQRRRCPCPERKSFGTSRDQPVQGSRQHCNRQCLRMDKLRPAANVQFPPTSGSPRSWRCSSSPLPQHRRPGHRTTAITPITPTTIPSGTARRQRARYLFCTRRDMSARAPLIFPEVVMLHSLKSQHFAIPRSLRTPWRCPECKSRFVYGEGVMALAPYRVTDTGEVKQGLACFCSTTCLLRWG
jgi:hypothetical protein